MSTGSVVEAPPKEALDLNESVHVALEEAASLLPKERFQPLPGSVFDAQGRVPVVVIRPGVGKGRGRHLYEADMLRENAAKFSGWRMYIDHQSPDARKAAGGLPRSVRDLGGRLTETWWEDSIPADTVKGHGQGAVVGLAKPVPYVRELIENDPEIIEASISAQATGVRAVTRDGQRVWLVEGIEDRGSLDWVTEAGAGGRVIPLLEAAYGTAEDVDLALLESMPDDEVHEYLKENRPDLIEALKAVEDGQGEEILAESNDGDDPEGGESDMAEITTETLQEALSESPNLIIEALTKSTEGQLFITGLVEAKMEEESELSEAKAEERVQRVIQLHDFEREAHRLISESRLPEKWQEGLRSKFSLEEGKPSEHLDVLDEVDDEGKVVKPAISRLRESVEQEIQAEREKLAEANPTRIRSQGGTASPGEAASTGFDPTKTGWGRFLSESAHVDPGKAYGIQGAGESA